MIVRSPRPKTNFTVVHNSVIRDQRLTWKARGLLVFLLSQPDNWRTTTAGLTVHGVDGRDSIRAGLKELELAGYLTRRTWQDERGHWRTETTVHDFPNSSTTCPQPEPDYPTSVMPVSNKELNNKDFVIPIGSKRKSVAPHVCPQCDATGYATNGKGLQPCPTCHGQRLL
jgi:hypothetical protein